ncbi:MAG TPA: BTAD domain-containing putative transcriptional regulator [Mycobacteriales bacterium]|nr:BTAD domain-containing putative transcriptional regulator [Mycobacteriales bacterium]
MDFGLALLADVRWRGTAVVGDRPQALLAALASAGGRTVSAERLVELVWGEQLPANAANSLQVLVSRTRAACSADAIVRDGAGYRLGIGPEQIDSVRLSELVRAAAQALEQDPAAAAGSAGEAIALAGKLPVAGDDGSVLAEVRRRAAAEVVTARSVLARAASRAGRHAEALPELETAHAERPDDEALLVDLLRSEAAASGTGAALQRYDRYRRRLREGSGSSPGEALQALHRELLARDEPVRTGVRYDATSLLGRDEDIVRLRALIGSSRVVSIVGPGGLGKTRLAHVIAREATQPVVHFVELVGVSSAEDVIGEIGSALGVRDSISSRRALTPEQLADIRGRIAQRLAQAPSLLVLDNCEHVVEVVAGLVGALIPTCPDLRVLTTSRSPLAIAAEAVYLLDELEPADSVRLFCERANAARPGVRLEEPVVQRIVDRLDGLPLAIELAAARVRAMSAEEIDRRLQDRFALLRGGDRSAPDRHQTLLAVIDWSWNLLDPERQRALRRLSLFNDGFTLDAAEAVLGDGALDTVPGLVDQSLLALHDTAGGGRYRMLETVREFGRMHLVRASEEADARAARRRWALAFVRRYGCQLMSPEQFTAIDELSVEEINLADELRESIAERDRESLVELLAGLGLFWAIRGEHGRLITVAGAVAEAVDGWTPPPESLEATRSALGITLTNALILRDNHTGPIRDLLTRIGPGENPRISGMVRVMLACDPSDPDFEARLQEFAADPDTDAAWMALQWLSNVRENSGDPQEAVVAAERALRLVSGGEDGPWAPAILRTQLAALTMHLGDRRRAVEHARAALSVMIRLGAKDDEVQLRSLLALSAISEGDLDFAAEQLELIDAIDRSRIFGGVAVGIVCHAELTLARGDRVAGLRDHRECVQKMQELNWPGYSVTGVEPWLLFGEATALTAHAYYATTASDVAHGWRLYTSSRERSVRVLDPDSAFLDFPVAGLALFGLSAWCLHRIPSADSTAVRLLALADRFAYNRTIPTMDWDRFASLAEQRCPGRLETALAGYRERRSSELLDEARTLIEQLPPRLSELPLVAGDGQRSEDRDHDEPGQ